jgi:glycosyltransferase involved in cell wall biosynthesis
MAKLLLCCDEYIYQHKDKYYFANQEWCDFFHRYLRVFEKMRLVTRCKAESSLNKNRVAIDIDEIDYVPLPFFQGPWQYAQNYFSISRVLDSAIEGCDCALLRLPFAISERLGKILVKKDIPYALEIVFDAEDAWKNSTTFVEKLLWLRIDRNMRFLAVNADGISCVTEFYLQQHYYSKKSNSFKSHYSSLSLENSFFTSARIHPKGKIFTIANIANQVDYYGRKGHVEIIKAIGLLKKQGLVVNVKFAGSDYNEGIRKLSDLANELRVSSQVEFLGYMQRQEISDYLDESDLYVMPTKSEGLPRVIIEAMAKGLPCITTNVSGNSELIESQFLIDDYYDINSWAEQIKFLVINKKAYENASRYNFNNSLNYEAKKLQARRDAFYTHLKAIATNKE